MPGWPSLKSCAYLKSMARRLRLEYPGAIYHVINRGNYRREVFATSGAIAAFRRTLEEACCRHGWLLPAYVVMRHHFHLALTTPSPSLEQGMHWLLSTFAVRFNRFRAEHGHPFQGRYPSLLIEDAQALARVVDYIHLNPVRAGRIALAEIETFPHGSLAILRRRPRPACLDPGPWLRLLDLSDDEMGWGRYVARLQSRAVEAQTGSLEDTADYDRGWAIGSDAWRRQFAHE